MSPLTKKVCTRCKVKKDTIEFHKDKNRKDGLHLECKKCRSAESRERRIKHPPTLDERRKNSENSMRYYWINRDTVLVKMRRWKRDNPEKVNETTTRYRKSHPARLTETAIAWQKANPEKALASRMLYAKNHPEAITATKKRGHKKRQSTPCGRLDMNLSASVWASLKGNKAGRHWETLVGYTVDQLKKHLEKLFKPGMTWGNYGTVWVIDHNIPKAVFNYEHPEDLDFRICWSLKNLQPLDKIENCKKGSKIEKPFQASLLLGKVSTGV